LRTPHRLLWRSLLPPTQQRTLILTTTQIIRSLNHPSNLSGVLIRLAEVSDAAALLEIYNAEVLGSTATFDLVPRSLDDQRQWLRDRTGAMAAIVAEIDDDVAGFASLSPYRSRPAYSTTVENSIYVHADHRRKGIAQALMSALITTARSHGFHAMVARIADGAPASVALHSAVGFELAGIEREVGRKFNRWRDVHVMQLLLDTPGRDPR